MASPHYLCLQDALARVQGLGLQGVNGGPAPNVLATRLPVDRDPPAALPFVQVSFGGQELLGDGSFEDTEVGYPVLVTSADATNQGYAVALADEPVLVWRHAVAAAFMDLPERLGTPEIACFRVAVEFGPVVVPELFHDQNVWASQLILRYWLMESRKRP